MLQTYACIPRLPHISVFRTPMAERERERRESPRTPCIGSSRAGAGRCSRPRTPCIGSSDAGAGTGFAPSWLWRLPLLCRPHRSFSACGRSRPPLPRPPSARRPLPRRVPAWQSGLPTVKRLAVILGLNFFLCVRNTLITCYAPKVWTNFKLPGPAGSPQGSTGVHRATGWSSAAAGAAPHSCCRRTVAETAGPPRGRAGRDGRQWGRPAGDKKCRADAKLSEPSHSLLGTAARACGRSPVSRLCPLRLLHHRAPHGLWVPA